MSRGQAIRLEFEQEKRTMTAKLQAEAEIQPFLKSGHATKPVEEEKLSTTKPLVAMPPKVISRRTALKAILDSGNSPVNPSSSDFGTCQVKNICPWSCCCQVVCRRGHNQNLAATEASFPAPHQPNGRKAPQIC